MARMIPRELRDYNNSYGEKSVFEALKKLPDDYTVFHSVKWNKRNERGRVVWGECDFTIFHPLKGILVIEVKSGGIEYNEGRWTQIRTDTGERNRMECPLTQAGRSKYRFIEFLEEQLPNNYYCYIEQAVWFPSVSSRDTIGQLPKQYVDKIVLLENALDHPLKYIDQIYEYYQSQHHTRLNEACSTAIENLFAPLFQAVPSITARKAEREYHFVRLTNEQNMLLDYLEEQMTATIQGCAGTGKTMLAVEKARRLAQQDKVLFLCFNKFLYEYLESSFPNENIKYTNLYSLACQKMRVPSVDISDIQFYLNHYDEYGWDYKHIIADEGQDFEDQEIQLLHAISEIGQGCFYIFYDKNQWIQRRSFPEWLNNAECRLILNKNCRNTFQIASTSGKPISLKPKLPNGSVQGDMPNFYISATRSAFIKDLENVIAKYMHIGFLQSQICILTVKTETSSILNGVETVGKISISDRRTEKDILFTTVRKFKGLEADVIILIDVDHMTFQSDEDRRIFYVGSSRAKHYLDVMFVGSNNEDLVLLSNSIDEKNAGKNVLRGIATSLNVKPQING
jgi:hypothetical protein